MRTIRARQKHNCNLRARHSRTGNAVRISENNARFHFGVGTVIGAMRKSARVIARRLRNRRATGGYSFGRIAANGRENKNGRRRHCRKRRAFVRRANCFAEADSHRQREFADGGDFGGRRNNNRKRRPRTRNFRLGELSQQNGRECARRGKRDDLHSRRFAIARGGLFAAARQNRIRHLSLRDRRLRRRSDFAQCGREIHARFAGQTLIGGRDSFRRRRFFAHYYALSSARGGCCDCALSGISD